jgi:outer membrane protein OmpA-like peptidoglycan-associated protein
VLLHPTGSPPQVTGQVEPGAAEPVRPAGPGRPLDPDARWFFERRLGADLRQVRVHAGPAAAAAAADQHARGYTVGEHVVLGADADQQVLAHELVHVLQQRRASRPAVQRQEQLRLSGVGRTPPDVDFDVATERPASEDAHVLFGHDSVSLSRLDLAKLLPQLVDATGPLLVHIDGYSSSEGDQDYNVNLSAHRAAAIRTVLLTLLPDGSEVRLHAHGATAEFGPTRGHNRRVGIRLEALSTEPSPPTVIPPGLAGRLRLVPELELRIDPSQIPLAPGELPPIPRLQLGEPLPGGPGFGTTPLRPYQLPTVVPELRPTLPAPGTGEPPSPFRPELFRLTPRPNLVDWPALRQTFVDHGAGLISLRLAEDAEAFTNYWYYFYRSLGLPEDRARSLANFGTRLTVSTELAKEGNTPADRIDNELRQHGLPTPIGGSVDVLDLWRRLRGEKKKGGGSR